MKLPGLTKVLVVAPVAMCLLLTACASQAPTAPAATSSGAPSPTVSAPNQVTTLGIEGQAWMLTGDTVSVRTGATWKAISPPLPPAPGNSVAILGQLAVVASLNGSALTVQSSVDGGATWSKNGAQLNAPTTGVTVALSPSSVIRYIVGADPQISAAAPSQYTAGFINNPDGSLKQVSVPGPVSKLAWNGSALLVPGGPMSSHLYRSTDNASTWSDISKLALGYVPPASNVPVTATSFGAVIGLASGSAVLPAEHVSNGTPTLDIYTTRDGLHFSKPATISLSGQDTSVGLVVSSYGPDQAVVLNPGTLDIFVVDATGVRATFHAAGLPAPPDAISFQSATAGLAQVTIRSCASGKTTCSATPAVFSTADGGRTWSAN